MNTPERTKRETQNRIKLFKRQECGNCDKWMTKACPREEHHIVHMNEWGCQHFNLKNYNKSRIKELEKELFLHDI